MIIDAQVHTYERDHPGRPWVNRLHGPEEMTGAQMIAAMDAAGVDAAVQVSSWVLYRDDPGYAIECRDAWPDRLAIVCPLDPGDPDAADRVADLAAVPGMVAVRVISMPADAVPSMRSIFPVAPEDAGNAALNRIFEAAARHSMPVNYTCIGCLDQAAAIVAAHPNCRIVIDHMGLRQPFEPPVPADAFDDLPKVLKLARFDNVVLKASGIATLSRQGYPFDDLWGPLARAIDAFGIDRCMWGTDWTRALSMVGYRESVDAFRLTDRLSAGDRDAFLGGTLRDVYGWSPGGS